MRSGTSSCPRRSSRCTSAFRTCCTSGSRSQRTRPRSSTSTNPTTSPTCHRTCASASRISRTSARTRRSTFGRCTRPIGNFRRTSPFRRSGRKWWRSRRMPPPRRTGPRQTTSPWCCRRRASAFRSSRTLATTGRYTFDCCTGPTCSCPRTTAFRPSRSSGTGSGRTPPPRCTASSQTTFPWCCRRCASAFRSSRTLATTRPYRERCRMRSTSSHSRTTACRRRRRPGSRLGRTSLRRSTQTRRTTFSRRYRRCATACRSCRTLPTRGRCSPARDPRRAAAWHRPGSRHSMGRCSTRPRRRRERSLPRRPTRRCHPRRRSQNPRGCWCSRRTATRSRGRRRGHVQERSHERVASEAALSTTSNSTHNTHKWGLASTSPPVQHRPARAATGEAGEGHEVYPEQSLLRYGCHPPRVCPRQPTVPASI